MKISIKKILRWILTDINCRIYGIGHVKGLYLGLCSKVSGNQHITIGGAKFMPFSMVVAHPGSCIEIGENSEISMFSRVASARYVKIGKDVLTGPHVFICDYNHEYRDVSKPIMRQGKVVKESSPGNPVLEICDGVWLGTNVVVVGKLKIGKNSVIGANSVVIDDIPDYCVAAGIPARIIKKYNKQNGIWEKVNYM